MKLQSIACLCLFLTGCSQSVTASEEDTHVLYRSGGVLPEMPMGSRLELEAMRIHVATFDAANGDGYNRDNCQTAAKLFAGQAGVTARYWCEKGRFRP